MDVASDAWLLSPFEKMTGLQMSDQTDILTSSQRWLREDEEKISRFKSIHKVLHLVIASTFNLEGLGTGQKPHYKNLLYKTAQRINSLDLGPNATFSTAQPSGQTYPLLVC